MKKLITIIVTVLIVTIGIAIAVGYWYWNKTISEFDFLDKTPSLVHNTQILKEFLPEILGTKEEKTYLILFQNNTEMRPSGGFIGLYALITIKDKEIVSYRVDDSYDLDRQVEGILEIPAPEPLKQYNATPLWFFRDSNWSPDFPVSAQKALWFFEKESEIASPNESLEVNGVIGITPSFISSILDITGPLEAEELEFTRDNFTEKLEYEVEYGWKERGDTWEGRKRIIKPLTDELIKKIKQFSIKEWIHLFALTKQALREKQIMVYFSDPDLQTVAQKEGWTGEIKESKEDYLMVVDASLASLKTDPSVKRTISYNLTETSNKKIIAQIDITYRHEGQFDWKTTRYRTYTRIYTPLGSKLISGSGAMKRDRSSEPGDYQISEELGKTVFGAFVAVEPGETKTLSLTYELPKSLLDQIKKEGYNLLVQKQPGTEGHELIVDLYLGGKLKRFETDLRVDREFKVKF